MLIFLLLSLDRSREKRRISDLVLETRVLELTRENSILKAELYAIKEKFGISQSQVSNATLAVAVIISNDLIDK